MSLLGALAAQLPIPAIRTPLGTFGAGTVAEIIDLVSRGRVSAVPHILLGSISFDLVTYLEGMERKVEADYAELAVLGGKPRLQSVGDKLDEYTWQIVLHAGYCDPQAELAKIEAAVRGHEAMPLIFASGDYKGWFVPVSMSETYRATHADGRPIWVEATLTLREHVLPPIIAQKSEPKAAEKAGANGKAKKPAATKKRAAPQRSKSQSVTRAGKR